MAVLLLVPLTSTRIVGMVGCVAFVSVNLVLTVWLRGHAGGSQAVRRTSARLPAARAHSGPRNHGFRRTIGTPEAGLDGLRPVSGALAVVRIRERHNAASSALTCILWHGVGKGCVRTRMTHDTSKTRLKTCSEAGYPDSGGAPGSPRANDGIGAQQAN